MISNLQFRCRDLFFDSHKLFSRFSFRNPRSAIRIRRPGGTPIFFALAALRSVLHRKRHLRQAGSQFRGLATAIEAPCPSLVQLKRDRESSKCKVVIIPFYCSSLAPPVRLGGLRGMCSLEHFHEISWLVLFSSTSKNLFCPSQSFAIDKFPHSPLTNRHFLLIASCSLWRSMLFIIAFYPQ